MNLSNLASKLLKKARRLYEGDDLRQLTPVYCREAPSNQTIADILRGAWFAEFPPEYGVITHGTVKHFDFTVDPRVQWVNSVLPNGIKDLSILELGPFEAYNTWQMEQLGSGAIVSIESNNINFIKCLLVKSITGLKAQFLYGDFLPYLRDCEKTYDIVWASGVLYHQTQPLELINHVAKVSRRVFVSTHYYRHDVISQDREKMCHFSPERDTTTIFQGLRVPLHYRSYLGNKRALFAGGSQDFSYWIEKEDMLESFRRAGLTKIDIYKDDLASAFGPALMFLASKE
jgi:SAM-dependent methyltransferase